MRITTILAAGLVLVAIQSEAMAQSGAKFLQKFNDWSTFSYEGDGGKLCFAVTKPKDFEPKNVPRGDVYFYVSTWPQDNVTNEVSMKIGYEFASDKATTIEIGSETFTLFNNGDRAFVESPATEAKLVTAMRRGARMTVRAVSARGTQTTDSYSLSGVTAALNYVARNCN